MFSFSHHHLRFLMYRFFIVFSVFFVAAGLWGPAQAADRGTAPPDRADGITLLGETGLPDDGDADDDTDESSTAPAEDGPSLSVDVGGSIRFNTLFRDYGTDFSSDQKLRDGGFTFDTFRINASGSYGRLLFDTEYAIYPDAFGGLFIHHGWVGYNVSDAVQAQVGVSQVPFGIQPYASSSWFFNNTYYVGLEDDYDAGIKLMYQTGPWDVQAAYYLNAEGNSFYGGNDAQRYSYDVVSSTPGGLSQAGRGISEENQFNGKVAYAFNHGDLGFTKVGVSGQYGRLLNEGNGETDSHYAYAGHVQGRYGAFGAKLEVAQQTFHPPGVADEEFVTMGAYNGAYRVASEHTVYSSSVSYRVPVDLGPISQVKPYYDFSAVTKNVEGWNDNVSHITGFLTSAGPLFVYTDLIISKGHPFNQPFDGSFGTIMAQQADNEWRTAFNLNIGLYF
jgi:hypothetical protein